MLRRILWLIALLVLALFTLAPRSEAQTLPDCPWPTTGNINAATTYTLTENCKVTGRMSISGSSTVTINGGGYTVDGSALRTKAAIIESFSNTNLIVNNITFIGGGASGKGALHLGGNATISNTTLRNVYRSAILGSVNSGGTYALSNILIENVTGVYFHYAEANMAIQGNHSAAFTVNNIVLRNAKGGNAAVGIFPNSGASITMTGCFTADGVWHQAFFGAVDTSGITGACSGSIGNGGTA